jgi:nitroreductase
VSAVETWDAITSRRNVRQFADRPIAEDDLDRILEAGRRAPSSQNWQPWDFVVVRDRDQLQELSKVWRHGGHVADSAATIALVTQESDDQRTREITQYDLGQTSMAMMIMAADLGIGSGHSAVEDQEKAREVLGHPQGRRVAYLIDLGYPADRPPSTDQAAEAASVRRGRAQRPLVGGTVGAELQKSRRMPIHEVWVRVRRTSRPARSGASSK